jgi:hypothetical protein
MDSETRADLMEAVTSWRQRLNQRYKTLLLLVERNNDWITPRNLRERFPEISDPSTVLYDIALRNPDYSSRGKDYYKRFRIYPEGYSGEAILEFSEINGYRIRPSYYEIVKTYV